MNNQAILEERSETERIAQNAATVFPTIKENQNDPTFSDDGSNISVEVGSCIFTFPAKMVAFFICDTNFSTVVEFDECPEPCATEIRTEFKSRLKDWGGPQCGFKLREVPYTILEGGIVTGFKRPYSKIIPATLDQLNRELSEAHA